MLRTKSIYEAHCRGLEGPLYQHISTTFGMVRNSALNKLNYFHVVKGLVPDIMHNVLEGKRNSIHLQINYPVFDF